MNHSPLVTRSRWPLTALCAVLIVGCSSFSGRSVQPGVEPDPFCTDRTGVGGFDCPPPMATPGAGPTVGVSAQPSVRNLREAALSDLYTLRSLQSEFYRLHQSYSRFLEELDFDPSPRVSVQLLRVTDEGWSAVARVRSIQLECAIHDGNVGPARAYASKEGVAACDR